MTLVLMSAGLAIALLMVLVSLAVLNANSRLRLVVPRCERVSPDDVPPDVRSLLAPGARRVAELGFVEQGALRVASLVVGEQAVPQFCIVFTHPDAAAAAFVSQMLARDRERHFWIQFVSRADDGTTLLTRNRFGMAGPIAVPHVVTQDCWLPTWRAVWQAHRERLQRIHADASQWQRLSAEQWIEASIEHERQAFEARVARGDLLVVGAGQHRFAWRYMLASLLRAWASWVRSLRRMTDDEAAPPGAAVAADAALRAATGMNTPQGLQAQVEAYERDARQRSASRWSNGAKWLLFGATAALAALSFGLSMTLGSLLALLLVLLFHEMGHFVAMRWAGYQDLKVFFLPFLGAAVSGRHDKPTARQELIVLYAGPLPGLVLGLAGLWWIGAGWPWASWWKDLAVLAVVVNAFNLLPIHPLDGGKIFEILLLGRWPWLAFAGRVAGMAALAAFAWSLDDGIARSVLLALVVLMSLGITTLWREARLASALRRRGHRGGLERTQALHVVFDGQRSLGYAARPWPEQRLIADALLPALTRPPMRRSARALGLAGYVLALTSPLLVLVVQVRLNMAPPARSATGAAAPAVDRSAALRDWQVQRTRELEDLRARVLAQADPVRRWSLLESELGAISEQLGNGDPAMRAPGEALLREAAALAPRLPDSTAKAARVELWRHAAAHRSAERQAHLQAVLDLYAGPNAAAADPAPLVQATVAWLRESPPGTAEQRQTRIDTALARAGDKVAASELLPLQADKADLLLAAGARDEALTLLQGLYARALTAGDTATAVGAAQWRLDATWAADGADAALRLLDQMHGELSARFAETPGLPTSLVRQGMWVAESAGRADWQRAHAPLLAAEAAARELPLWSRALVFLVSGQSPERASVADLELAHWRGDSNEAQRIASALVTQRTGPRMRLYRYAGTQRLIEPKKVEAINDARRALYQRYGMPVS